MPLDSPTSALTSYSTAIHDWARRKIPTVANFVATAVYASASRPSLASCTYLRRPFSGTAVTSVPFRGTGPPDNLLKRILRRVMWQAATAAGFTSAWVAPDAGWNQQRQHRAPGRPAVGDVRGLETGAQRAATTSRAGETCGRGCAGSGDRRTAPVRGLETRAQRCTALAGDWRAAVRCLSQPSASRQCPVPKPENFRENFRVTLGAAEADKDYGIGRSSRAGGASVFRKPISRCLEPLSRAA